MAGKGHTGLGTYVVVWVILLVLTALTYILAKAPLGNWHVPVALLIATTKCTLVVLIFMHLKDHSKVNQAFFVLSLVFVLVLIGFVLSDIVTRLPVTNPNSEVNTIAETAHLPPGAPRPQPSSGGH